MELTCVSWPLGERRAARRRTAACWTKQSLACSLAHRLSQEAPRPAGIRRFIGPVRWLCWRNGWEERRAVSEIHYEREVGRRDVVLGLGPSVP